MQMDYIKEILRNLKIEMENKISVFNCSVIDLGKISFWWRKLIPIVEKRKRFSIWCETGFLYLYDIAGGESRGAHAHKKCHQF